MGLEEQPHLSFDDARPRRELGDAYGGPLAIGDELGLDDAGLIEEYLGGNPAAYGELVRRYQISLFRLLLGLLADEDLAEEACENVFQIGERRLAELEDRDTCYQWLLGIAREVSHKFNERAAYEDTDAPETADPRDHLKREVHAVLQRLAPDLRLVLVLVELRGAPPEDVAAALGCPLAEVPALVAEARANFARILASRASEAPVTRAERSQVATPLLEPGVLVGARYRITRSLAKGGMGAVYAAQRIDDGLDVAIKTLLPGVITDEHAVRRFSREIEAIERVDHRNFVEVLDHGRSGDMPYLVMEYLRGDPLTARVSPGEAYEPRRALRIAREVLYALHQAHEVGVIHRDLKLDNLFVLGPAGGDEEGDEGRPKDRIKVLDLGLAKLMVDDESYAQTMLTEEGMIFGTPSYMAPEQALGEEVDLRTDLYAVAVILYRLLTGRLPFESVSPAALLVMQVSSVPPPLRESAPHLDGYGLQELLDLGLAKARGERYASAEEFVQQIDRALEGLQRSAEATPGSGGTTRGSTSRAAEVREAPGQGQPAQLHAGAQSGPATSSPIAQGSSLLLGLGVLMIILGLLVGAALYLKMI